MEIFIEAPSKVEALLITLAFREYGSVRRREDNRIWLVPHDLTSGDKFLDWLQDAEYTYEVY